ncbi:response regulator transcription factor [Bacillus massiliigorillae]|uniref:response regulator transcription factor n=1 Tax=Bacillus massiliigorillae TaxID=1243664 RepID=UPI0003AA989A|nr:response regulator transcription factor [Bacillus massiliigorillae]
MKQILVVDDDQEIVNLISIYLKNEGFLIHRASNGKEALELMNKENIDLLILDLMMPVMDGMEVCRRLREQDSLVPILMLTAKSEDIDKISGLMSGADDYLTKPFNPLEVVARVKTLLRRVYQYVSKPQSDLILIDNLEIDQQSHTVKAAGKVILLTAKEFSILTILASNPGRVYSAEELYQLVWKESYMNANNTIMVHISNLRDKLEKELGYKVIKTIWGVGYKIEK